MADKTGVLVEGAVDCHSREPTSAFLNSGYARLDVADDSGLSRRRRRPRKVVVYYFDSDDDKDDPEATRCGGGVSQREVCRGSSGSKHPPLQGAGTGVSEGDNSPVVEKMECPDVEELEGYSDGNNSNVRSGAAGTGAPAGAMMTCCCNCQAKKLVSVDNPRIGSPTPIGFFAFGMTTLLYNVHNAKICQLNMATMGLVVMFGGLTQFLCGFFELINMNTLGCTISTTYGAFWMATAVLFLQPENAYVTMGDHTYNGGFFLLWFFFAGTLFASAFRSPFMCMALFFLVPLNFLLQSIGYFADSATVAKVAGYEGIVVGALATYLGMAFTLRDVYGRSLLPILFQKNLRYVEW
jgi:uncharacterized protein